MFILTCEYHTVVVHNINKNTYFGSNKIPRLKCLPLCRYTELKKQI